MITKSPYGGRLQVSTPRYAPRYQTHDVWGSHGNNETALSAIGGASGLWYIYAEFGLVNGDDASYIYSGGQSLQSCLDTIDAWGDGIISSYGALYPGLVFNFAARPQTAEKILAANLAAWQLTH